MRRGARARVRSPHLTRPQRQPGPPLLARRTGMSRMMTAARQAMRQITRQYDAQLHIGAQRHIINVLRQTVSLQFYDKALDLFEVAVAQGAWIGQHLRILLQTAEQCRFLEWELQL